MIGRIIFCCLKSWTGSLDISTEELSHLRVSVLILFAWICFSSTYISTAKKRECIVRDINSNWSWGRAQFSSAGYDRTVVWLPILLNYSRGIEIWIPSSWYQLPWVRRDRLVKYYPIHLDFTNGLVDMVTRENLLSRWSHTLLSWCLGRYNNRFYVDI